MEAAWLAQRKALKFQQSSYTLPDDLDMNVRSTIYLSPGIIPSIYGCFFAVIDPILHERYSLCVMIMSITLLIYVIYRVSCQSFRITFLVVYWGVPPRETPTVISQMQNNMVHIVGNRLFKTSTMTVNYTSYDI